MSVENWNPGQPTILQGDFAHYDLDDEHALAVAIGMHWSKKINLLGIVAELEPVYDRALLAACMGERLGFHHSRVWQGSSPDDFPEENVAYARGVISKIPYVGYEIPKLGAVDEMHRELIKAKQPIHIIANAALTSTAELVSKYPKLCKSNGLGIQFMGGVAMADGRPALNRKGHVTPDPLATNVLNDPAAAELVFDFMQSEKLPLGILSRYAARSAPFPLNYYDFLIASVGDKEVPTNMQERHHQILRDKWLKVHEPSVSELRGTLPATYNREQFVANYCSGIDPRIRADGDIVPYVSNFAMYDALNVVASHPKYRRQLFDPYNAVRYKTPDTVDIIGVSEQDTGVSDPNALRDFISCEEVEAYCLTNHYL